MPTAWKLMMVAVAAALAGCNPHASVPSSSPIEDRDREMRGFLYAPDAMSITENDFAWVQQALSDYRRTSDADVPARIGQLRASSCDFAAPAPDERVLHAHLGGGVQATPIHWVASNAISGRAKALLDGYTAGLTPTQLAPMVLEQDRMEVINVVVTETTAPVYLVLSSEESVVWNIQAAADARITRVAIVSGAAAAIVNAPPDAQVSALDGSRVRRCGAYPHRMPRDDWGFIANVRSVGGGSTALDATIRENQRDARRYRTWLARTFGIRDEGDGPAALGVSNVLLGPLPTSGDARIPFRPIAGADLFVTSGGHLFPTGEDEYRRGVRQLVSEALARAGAGHIVDFIEGS